MLKLSDGCFVPLPLGLLPLLLRMQQGRNRERLLFCSLGSYVFYHVD